MFNNAEDLFKNEYISYSRLSSYDQCPYSFKLKYLQKKPTKSSRAADLGSAVHETIAVYLKECKNNGVPVIKPEVSDVKQRIDRALNLLHSNDDITNDFSEHEITPFLQSFCSMMPSIDSRSIHGIETEKNFTINGQKYKCIIDLLLCDSKGNYTLIDFKTGKPQYVSDLQIKLYALPLFSDNQVPPIHLIYAFLKFKETQRFVFSYDDALMHMKYMSKKVKQITQDADYFPSKSFLCRYCDVREYCTHY
jgi:ATP-dependent exoDNAse (exonuclease V) beta subunit